MQCYVCDKGRVERAAVGNCPKCSAGLCAAHMRESELVRSSATSWASCGHLPAETKLAR
jgi:hypothetical protein